MAEVSSPLPQKFADELTRHKLTKAAWSRLLSPWKEVQRIHNRLLPEDEVPDGEVPPGLECVSSSLYIPDRVAATGEAEEAYKPFRTGVRSAC